MAQILRDKFLSFGDAHRTDALTLVNIGYNDFHYVEAVKVKHRQDGYTLHLVVGGQGELHVGGKVHRIGAGDVFFLPPDEPMMYYPDPADPWSYYWFFLRGDAMPALQERLAFSVDAPVRRCPQTERCARMCYDLMTGEHGATESYFAGLSALFALVGALCQTEAASPRLRASGIVGETRSLIELNYRNPDFGVEELSRMAHVSHSYLCKLFREETGTTLVGYLTEVRHQAAVRLLAADPDITVRELCRRVGGRDEVHFMKSFKRRFGVTVSEYKQDANKDKE